MSDLTERIDRQLGIQHKAYITDDGKIACKDTCPRQDCEEAMRDWNGMSGVSD